VETGRPARVIHITVKAAERATINAPAIVSIAPNLPNVCDAPAPLWTAPKIRKIAQIKAAV